MSYSDRPAGEAQSRGLWWPRGDPAWSHCDSGAPGELATQPLGVRRVSGAEAEGGRRGAWSTGWGWCGWDTEGDRGDWMGWPSGLPPSWLLLEETSVNKERMGVAPSFPVGSQGS